MTVAVLFSARAELEFAYNITSRDVPVNVVCGLYRDIEARPAGLKTLSTKPDTLSFAKSKYYAHIDPDAGLLTISNPEQTHTWMQADLTNVYVDGCNEHPEYKDSLALAQDGATVTITQRDDIGTATRLIVRFEDDYIYYSTETDFTVTQGHGGQSFLTGYVGGDSIGMLNPDTHGDILDGLFQDIRLPTEEEIIMRNAISYAPKQYDDLHFSPTTDAWYLTSDAGTLIHGLAGLNPSDGITLKIPEGKNFISAHYANVSNTVGIFEHEPKKGVDAVIAFTDQNDLYQAFQAYYDALDTEGLIKQSSHSPADWWSGGIYCTWFESHDKESPRGERVYAAADSFEENDIPVRTIIIDEGWAGVGIYGDWEYDPEYYPYENGLRTLVDDLHERGYKVLLHFMPFDVSRSSRVYQEHPEYTVWGRFDYTNEDVREHMKERLRVMLSSDADAYNADGLKVDFIQHFNNSASFSKQYRDPYKGRGGDYLHFALQWLYETAKEIKPDAHISGFGVHPFFQDTFDSIRTGDFAGKNVSTGIKRMTIKNILMPHTPTIYDLHQGGHWDFASSALGYSTGIPHMVYKIADGYEGAFSALPEMARAYDSVRNQIQRTSLEDPMEFIGRDPDGNVIWEPSADGNGLTVYDGDAIITLTNPH